jgi:hypothetical protein
MILPANGKRLIIAYRLAGLIQFPLAGINHPGHDQALSPASIFDQAPLDQSLI